MKKIQLPKSLNNPLTVLGAGVALIAGVTLAFLPGPHRHRRRIESFAAIGQAILTGAISHTLPDIKRIAVEAMQRPYDTEPEALQAIAAAIPAFYRENYPDLATERRADIEKAVLATQEQFAQNIFPEMRVRWEGYPDNIGHVIFPGCMRCHDGKKVSEEGLTITRECTACHVILRRGAGENMQMAVTEEGLPQLGCAQPELHARFVTVVDRLPEHPGSRAGRDGGRTQARGRLGIEVARPGRGSDFSWVPARGAFGAPRFFFLRVLWEFPVDGAGALP
ncbi:MAG: hypothetical protein L0Z51_10810 [Candidatus Latescibacteria bacterium]|nr:hypothetical protein [Candidatus Latescibacterota bacterium]